MAQKDCSGSAWWENRSAVSLAQSKIGDMVSIDWDDDGDIDHSAIAGKIVKKRPLLTYQSSNALDVSIPEMKRKCSGNPNDSLIKVRIFRVYQTWGRGLAGGPGGSGGGSW